MVAKSISDSSEIELQNDDLDLIMMEFPEQKELKE